MSDIRSPETSSRLELLHQLLASATHDASAAMCRWTNGLITLSLDEVRELPIDEVCSSMDMDEEQLTMVALHLNGEVGGDMILTFDEQDGRELVATLLSREITTGEEWSDLEKSALTETGNILGCAYINALTRLISTTLDPSPPYFIQDYGASVLEQALASQAMTSETALICRTQFHRDGQELDWNVFFFPTAPLREELENALQSLS